jgi:hypothetical protein
MAGGELPAVFRALAQDAAEGAEKAAESLAKVTEQTANIEESNVSEVLEADAKAADRITAARQERHAGGRLRPARAALDPGLMARPPACAPFVY